MVKVVHMLANDGFFKSVFSSVDRKQKIFEMKKDYRYARLVRKENCKIEDISSNIGVALMSSLEDKNKGYSVFFIEDEDVIDFLFFDNILILKTNRYVYSYEWKNDIFLFKKEITFDATIDLVEPSMIIERTFKTNNILDNIKGKISSKLKGDGFLIDSLYQDGKTVIASIKAPELHQVEEETIHFSLYKTNDNGISEFEHEIELPFPYEKLEESMNTADKLRWFYLSEEEEKLRKKIVSMKEQYDYFKENQQKKNTCTAIMRTLKNELEHLKFKYEKTWREKEGSGNLVRIIGFSSNENVFYFSFQDVLFSMDIVKKEWKTVGYQSSKVSLVKVIPNLVKDNVKTREDLLIFRRTLLSENQYRFEAIEVSEITKDENKFYHCSPINRNNFISELNIKDARNYFFQYENRFVEPKEVILHYRKNRWSENSHRFISSDFMPIIATNEKELFGFFGKDFSIVHIENNRLIQKSVKKDYEVEVDNVFGIESQAKFLSEEKNDSLSNELAFVNGESHIAPTSTIYNAPFIHEEDKEMIRRLTQQSEWFMPKCKPEREMISLLIPDMIQKYQENNQDEVYLEAINEILKLLKQIQEKKDFYEKEKNHFDAKFVVEYAKSLME